MAKSQNIIMLVGILVILLLMITIFPLTQPKLTNQYGELKKFSSLEELNEFLKQTQTQPNYINTLDSITPMADVQKSITSAESGGDSSSSVDYSQTNIQVQGVDEADIVKNDDKYIYVASSGKISIIEAYPANTAKVSTELDINGTAHEIFINENKLVVFGSENYYGGSGGVMPLERKVASIAIFPPIYYAPQSFIKVYDIQDKENPKLEKEVVYDGDYYDSRMIDDYVYVIANQPINYNNEVVMPIIKNDDNEVKIAAEDIYYFNVPYYDYRLTTIFAVNLDNLELNKNSFLTGYSQNIFVSRDNIYLTTQKYIPQTEYEDLEEEIIKQGLIPLVDESTAQKIRSILNKNDNIYEKQQEIQEVLASYYNKLGSNEKEDLLKDYDKRALEIRAEFQKNSEKTIIHKISVSNDQIEYKAKGEVSGRTLNQFSMDEYQGNFRIATTTGDTWSGNSLNHVYVLDEGMSIIGKLEDLARTEQIFSVRFIEDRAYLVTFKNIDPLFVIDLSNPENPEVLGELKIPGYSNYLHPYDSTHIIGIGKEAIDSGGNSNFALYQGVKLALFDVSDVSNPKEISKFNIGDRGTDSRALYEHKAFLFNKEKELLVIPISLNEVNAADYPNGIPANAYGELTFQGAYVLSLNLEDGFELKGKITHLTDEELAKFGKERYYYPSYGSEITRSLFIDNVLYTISSKYIKANSLDNLQELNKLKLPFEENIYSILY